MNLGSSSLILVFIVLCLVILGMLTLKNAQVDELMAVHMAAAVQAYYQADKQGEKFVQTVYQALKDTETNNILMAEYMQRLSEETYQNDINEFSSDIFLNSGQILRVKLCVDWKDSEVRVCSWRIFPKEEPEMNQSMGVWNGE